MNFLYYITFLLLCTFYSVYGARRLPDVTYKELEQMGVSCNTLDNCKRRRHVDELIFKTCHCGSFCSQLDTCCIDSPFRGKRNAINPPSCMKAYGTDDTYYFMVDKCPDSENGIWGNLCRESYVEDGDLLPLVPVTSFSTNVTYKNYFCFRCHERGDKYHYWNVGIHSGVKSDKIEQRNIALTYNDIQRTWVAPVGERGSLIPVTFSVEAHPDIQELSKRCVPNVISSCSGDWKNHTIYHKCNAYTSIVHFIYNGEAFSYRNPHCALCNHEILEDMHCTLVSLIDGRTEIKTSKAPFSFTHLLDINPTDGERVGKIQQCDSGSMWDPFFKKCRTLRCAVRNYVIRNGKCVPPG